jgi:outer membrane receptor protein involved in Fe transport
MRSTWKSRGRGASAGLVGLSLLAVTGTSFAVEEVVVTTRKREEKLQDVPIAVDVLGTQVLQDRAINDLAELTRQSPSVQFDTGFSPQDTRIAIRGLSPTRGRQNVAVLQDGVDVSSETVGGTAGGSLLINPRLFDVERVEIVKGPQIGLYGRSAFAGAINYVTKAPGDELEGAVGTELGNEGQQQFQGRISGPLTDTISAGVSGMIWSRDGFYTNDFTGQEMGNQEGNSVAGTLRWRPTDKLDVRLRVENLDDEFGVTPFANTPFNPAFGGPFNRDFLVPVEAQQAGVVSPTLGAVSGWAGELPDASALRPRMSEDPRTCTSSGAPECSNFPGTERNITRATLNLTWDLGPVLFTSLSHVADADTSQWEGSEDVSAWAAFDPADPIQPNGGATAAEFILENSTKLYSQEFRIASNKPDSRVQWLGGALLWRENVDVEDGSYTCLNYTGFPTFQPGGPQPCGPFMADISKGAPLNVPGDGLTPLNADRWQRKTEHWSIYGLVEWEFIDRWKVTLEGRQTWEDLDALGPDYDNGIIDPSGTFCGLAGGDACFNILGPGTQANGLTVVPNRRGGSSSDSFFAPKVTLTWEPTDDALMYVSFAETFKPEGISTLLAGTGAFFQRSCVENPTTGVPLAEPVCDPVAGFRFKQERLDYYEFGWKTDWFDQRLRVNGAVFFQDFKNKQVSTQVTDPNNGLVVGRILNAGKAEILGIELDVTWRVTENLTVSGAHTWLDTEYTDFKSNTTGVGRIAYAGNCTPVTVGEGVNARTNCQVSYDGNELERAPENSFFGNVRYQRNLVGDTQWFVEADAIFQDQRFTSEDNRMILPDYWLANFRFGIRNDQWDVIGYVDNAFDDDTIKVAFNDGDIPTFFATNRFVDKGTITLPDPRLYGIRVNYRFGAK